MWWFATTVLIDGSLSRDLIPPAVVDQLVRHHRKTRIGQHFPEPTPFMLRLHNDDESYRSAYDLETDVGRFSFAFDLMLLGLENEVYHTFLGPAITDWMLTPLDGAVPLSPFEIMLLASTDGINPPSDAVVGVPPYSAAGPTAALRQFYDCLPSAGAIDDNPTVRVLGLLQSQTGLGVNMRMSMAALEKGGVPMEEVDVEHELLYPFIPSCDESNAVKPHRAIDLFHLNPDQIPALIARYSQRQRSDVYRIGFALWESSVMPEQHRAGASLLNEIWVPTTYVADIYRNAGFENVHIVGKGISLPDANTFDLKSLGIKPNDFTFLLSFDIDSWIERKNPVAALRAFQKAFPQDRDVKLIVKATGLRDHPGDRTRQVSTIIDIAERDDRILLVGEHYPFASYLGLLAACDATISPHRSEGFGYLPAYSMLLGTPSIVTNYSGTTDFCTEETSFPVDYDLVDIGPGDFVYDARGAQWANINVSALAATMRKVRDEPEVARLRTEKGAKLLAQEYSMAAMTARYVKRIKSIT